MQNSEVHVRARRKVGGDGDGNGAAYWEDVAMTFVVVHPEHRDAIDVVRAEHDFEGQNLKIAEHKVVTVEKGYSRQIDGPHVGRGTGG